MFTNPWRLTMARKTSGKRLGEWVARLRRFSRAGVSVAEFCRREEVSAASFYQWRKKLAQQGSALDDSGCDRQAVSRAVCGLLSGQLQGSFVPVRVTGALEEPVRNACVEASLPNGVTLHLPAEDRELIRMTVATLLQTPLVAGGA
jgi:transposase-like protein